MVEKNSCRIGFEGDQGPVEDAEWNAVVEQFDALRDVIREAGGEPAEVMARLISGDRSGPAGVIDDIIDQEILGQSTRLARNLQHVSRNAMVVDARKAEVQAVADANKGKKTPKQKIQKAIKDMIYTPAQGGRSLESMKKAARAKWVNQELVRKLNEAVGPGRWLRVLNDNQFRKNVIIELHNLQRGLNRSTDENARVYAEIIHDVRNRQRATLNELGDKLTYDYNGIPVHFEWGRIKGRRDDFVMSMAAALHDVHGTLEARKVLAGQIYDSLEQNHGVVDWDAIGQVRDEDTRPVILYKDGETWNGLNDKFGNQQFMETIIQEIEHLSGKEAAMRMFGPSPEFNLKKLISETMQISPDSVEAKKLIAKYDRLTKTHIPDYLRLSQAMGILRSIQIASKLGSAVITAITDTATLTYAMRRFHNAGYFEIFNSFLSGDRQRARELGIIGEGGLTFVHNRFGEGVDLTDRVSRTAKGSADLVMTLSGMNFWTDWVKASATRVLDARIGRALQHGVKWDGLHAEIRKGFLRYGITEADWASLNKTHLNGREFDLFRLDDNLRNKFTSYYIDSVESAVITPGAADREIARLGATPGTLGSEIATVLTQFMSFGISAHRRITYRTYLQQDHSVAHAMVALSPLVLVTLMQGALIVQSREVLKGNQAYDWNDPKLWAQSASYMPIGVIFDQWMRYGGQHLFEAMNDDEKSTFGKATDFLPPVLSDISKMFEHGAYALGGVVTGDKKQTRKNVASLTKDLLSTVPGQNLWWLRAAYRSAIVDNLHEIIDPAGYRRSRKAQLKRRERNAFGRALDSAL